MFSNSDIFLIAVFSVTIAIFEMVTRGVLTMDMIQGIFSGNITIYIISVVAIIFFRKYLKGSGAGSNRFSSTSHVSMGQYFEYTDEYETYWVEFTALFNNRRKRESRSPTQMYNILSIEIGLSASTLASFYRHQKSPRRTSVDKIIELVEKEGNKKVVSFSDSSSSNSSNNSNGGSSAK
ncbi:hypothetical protein F8M41_022968 [Gigaspora margarita]|uniref:Uncharacterized protein n=1 Tax=Gigaspora margarita TaxID=4874 RepID=A0A8H4AE78_GIGMA|nr:hypothetical protein F8M41_022968 [Gigaspora margarita]